VVQISAIYLQQDLSRTFYDTHRWVFEKGVSGLTMREYSTAWVHYFI